MKEPKVRVEDLRNGKSVKYNGWNVSKTPSGSYKAMSGKGKTRLFSDLAYMTDYIDNEKVMDENAEALARSVGGNEKPGPHTSKR